MDHICLDDIFLADLYQLLFDFLCLVVKLCLDFNRRQIKPEFLQQEFLKLRTCLKFRKLLVFFQTKNMFENLR